MIDDKLEMINGGIAGMNYRKITIVYKKIKSFIYHLSYLI